MLLIALANHPRFEEAHQYSRAACIAVFHYNLRRAAISLTKQAQYYSSMFYLQHSTDCFIPHSIPDQGGSTESINTQLIAMALSGYKEGGGRQWRETCRYREVTSSLRFNHTNLWKYFSKEALWSLFWSNVFVFGDKPWYLRPSLHNFCSIKRGSQS